MSDTPRLSEAKRALVESYLRGEIAKAPTGIDSHRAHDDVRATDSRENVVPIQTGGSKTPFFFLHGQYELGGGIYCFPLARALGPDRPFYAVEPYRLEGMAVPPSFEAMAAAHVESLRAVTPEGPYILGGWCNGALLAYEMARQLQAEGHRVDQLVLMDPVCLQYPAWLRLVRAAITGLGRTLRVGQDKHLDVYLRMRHRYRYVRHVLVSMRSREYRKSSGSGDFVREDYPGIYDWTALDYRPTSVYPGKITFIWSSTRPSLIHGFRVARFRKGWRRVETGRAVEVLVLPFGHWTCLNEHVDVLAERLNDSLSRVPSAS